MGKQIFPRLHLHLESMNISVHMQAWSILQKLRPIFTFCHFRSVCKTITRIRGFKRPWTCCVSVNQLATSLVLYRVACHSAVDILTATLQYLDCWRQRKHDRRVFVFCIKLFKPFCWYFNKKICLNGNFLKVGITFWVVEWFTMFIISWNRNSYEFLEYRIWGFLSPFMNYSMDEKIET